MDAGEAEGDVVHGDESPAIVVVVARTGGFAGIRREWRAAPPVDDQPKWIALIDRCPWDAEVGAGDGVDRFIWHIHAQCGPHEHRAELPEQAVQGPWRELVDVVRAGAPEPGATPSPTPAPRPAPSPRPTPSSPPAPPGASSD